MIRYVTEEMMRAICFPYIQKELTEVEVAPDYESEVTGIAELQKVLLFVQQDEYYPSFEEKASYILCSIAASQYFSNGNKRLAVVTLLQFLTLNEVSITEDSIEAYKAVLGEFFPQYNWENNPNIHSSHALFLYNLATVLGDRTKWEHDDFGILRSEVAELFSYLYRPANL